MIEDNKEDEYQFAELDGDHAFDDDIASDDVKTSFPSENNLRKIILSALAVVVIGFILFKFVSSYFLTKGDLGDTDLSAASSKPVVKSVVKQTPPIQHKTVERTIKPVVKETIKPFVYEQRKVPQPAVKVVTQTVTDPKVNDKLNFLRRASQKSSRKIIKINNNVGSLRESIDSLTSKISSLSQTIAALSDKVSTQQTELNKLRPKIKKTVTKKTKKPAIVTYHIKALIPGRGWLMSSKGETVTVIKGTELDGLGRVVSIDARHGKVAMTSGTIIQFSVSDT